MDKYTVSRSVVVAPNQKDLAQVAINIEVEPEQLRLTMKNHYGNGVVGGEVGYILSWEALDDVDQLAEIFAAERVDVFKNIVEMLGDLHKKRAAVLTVMAGMSGA